MDISLHGTTIRIYCVKYLTQVFWFAKKYLRNLCSTSTDFKYCKTTITASDAMLSRLSYPYTFLQGIAFVARIKTFS